MVILAFRLNFFVALKRRLTWSNAVTKFSVWKGKPTTYVGRWSFTHRTGTKSRHSIPSFPLKQVYHLRDFKAWITIENNRPRLNINYSKQRTTKGWEGKCLACEAGRFFLIYVLREANWLHCARSTSGLIESLELWKEKPGLQDKFILNSSSVLITLRENIHALVEILIIHCLPQH